MNIKLKKQFFFLNHNVIAFFQLRKTWLDIVNNTYALDYTLN